MTRLLWIGATLVATLVSCSRAPATRRRRHRLNPRVDAGGRLYVTNENSGDLTVIDTATRQVIATIPLGKRPRGIKVSPDGATLYVALSGSPMAPPGTDESKLPPPDRKADGIGVVDVKQGKLLRVIQGGSDPEQTAVSQDGRWLFVANEDAGQTSVIDISDGRVVATVPVGGEPEGVDLRPDGKVVYVTSEEDNQVAVIDAATAKLITTFKAGPRPRATGFLPDSSRAYISAETGSAVIVVDAQAHQAARDDQARRRRSGAADGCDRVGRRQARVRHDRPRQERRDHRHVDQQGRRQPWKLASAHGASRRPATATWCSPQTGRRTTYRSSTFRIAR